MATSHHPDSETSLRQLIQANRVELIALGVAIVGIFLMVEKLELRVTLLAWGVSAHQFLDEGAGWLSTRLSQLHASDLVGLGLVLAAIGFIYWRMRFRLLGSGRLEAGDCPRCHTAIHRFHRSRLDHLIGKVASLPLRRYRCRNCGWTGLRLRRSVDYATSSSRAPLNDR